MEYLHNPFFPQIMLSGKYVKIMGINEANRYFRTKKTKNNTMQAERSRVVS